MYSNIAIKCFVVMKVTASAVAAVRSVVMPWTSAGRDASTAAASGQFCRFVLGLGNPISFRLIREIRKIELHPIVVLDSK